MVIAVMYPPVMNARRIPVVTPKERVAKTATLPTLVDALGSMTDYSATVSYDVTLPMANDDVVYRLQLASSAAKADPLSDVTYLIDWTLERDEADSKGFLAYFNGHHYRFRDHRLQEYHYEWDSIPFITKPGGVQANGQFVELLPQSIARELKAMQANPAQFALRFTPDTVIDGAKAVAVSAVQTVNGFVGRNYQLVVDPATLRPVSIKNEYNPGSISEQSVHVAYTYPKPGTSPALTAVTAEEQLIALYPEVFEKFRENNYRIENMRGLPLPAFSLPTLTGERYTRQKGDPFKAPTVIALLDPKVEASAKTLAALRKAQAQMPREIDLIVALTGTNPEQNEALVGPSRMGETVLISGKSLARDCGTSVFPTILIVEPSGIVNNVILGFNNNLLSDVIQSLALVK